MFLEAPMQTCLWFEDAPAPVAPPARPAPVGQPPVRLDAQAEYASWQRDLEQLVEGWEDLHVWVLHRHLRLLASPHTEATERADILAWLDAPLVFDRPAGALSFQACLAVYDARLDPAEFQQLVRRANRQVVNHRRGRAA
jgi:hypothetical protein